MMKKSSQLFKPKESKPLKEEEMLITVLRNLLFQSIKDDLGEGYTAVDAEVVFQRFIAQKKADGTFAKILDDYLAKKIELERGKFSSGPG